MCADSGSSRRGIEKAQSRLEKTDPALSTRRAGKIRPHRHIRLARRSDGRGSEIIKIIDKNLSQIWPDSCFPTNGRARFIMNRAHFSLAWIKLLQMAYGILSWN